MEERKQLSLDELKEYPELFDEEELDDEDDEEEEFEPEDDDLEVEDQRIPVEDETPDLSLDDIFAAEDTAEEKLFIPEWGGNITLKPLSKNEVDFIRKRSHGKDVRTKSDRNALYERELFVAAVLIKGRNVTRTDYQRLLEKNAGVMIRITNHIAKKSGLEKDSEEERTARFPRKR